jgi:hypothetical protein
VDVELRRRPGLLSLGGVLLVVGYTIDQVWIAGKPDLSSAAEQAKGHVVLSLAAITIAAGCIRAVRSGTYTAGHVVALAGSLALGIADAVHSWEHLHRGGTGAIHDVLSAALVILVVGLLAIPITERISGASPGTRRRLLRSRDTGVDS